MKYILIGLIGIYIVTVIIAYGGFFASSQRTFPNHAEENYRIDMGLCMLLALIPFVNLIVSFFVTGFYEKGFKFW